MVQPIYKRVVVVEVAGLTIRGVKIELDIRREASRALQNSHVVVHNLARANERRIEDRGGNIRVTAGYEGRSGVVFDGAVDRVERDRESLARRTRIYLSPRFAARGPNRPDPDPPEPQPFYAAPVVGPLYDEVTSADHAVHGVFSHGYEGVVPVRDIAEDIVATMPGATTDESLLRVLPLPLIREDWSFTGTASDAMDDLLDGYLVDWFEDDGVVKFNFAGASLPQAVVVDLNPETGLVGTPSVTDDGVRARSFLNPLLRPGEEVRLASEAATGNYKIVAVRHHGSSWDGDEFYSEVDLREAEERVPAPAGTADEDTDDDLGLGGLGFRGVFG